MHQEIRLVRRPRNARNANTDLHPSSHRKRNDYVISTKINWGAANGDNPVNNGGLSRKHLVEGTHAALQRLGLDYVDLLYAHRPDRNTPMEETVRAFNYLIDTGKCFYWGTSEWNADEIERAHHVATKLNLVGPVMEQPQYNLLVRERVEKEYSLLYEEYNLGLTPFSPLKAGILTGKYNDGIPEDSRFATNKSMFEGSIKSLQSEEGKAKIEKVKKLTTIAEKLGGNTTQLALAWAAKNENVSTVILGATKVAQIEDNCKALALIPKLTPEIMEDIEKILDNKPAEPNSFGRKR